MIEEPKRKNERKRRKRIKGPGKGRCRSQPPQKERTTVPECTKDETFCGPLPVFQRKGNKKKKSESSFRERVPLNKGKARIRDRAELAEKDCFSAESGEEERDPEEKSDS